MRKHKQEIISKSGLLEEDIDLLLLLIEKQVTIIPKVEFLSEILQAEAVLREHKKDIPYVALALHLTCPIWSYEKRLDNIKGIEIFTTREIINLIK